MRWFRLKRNKNGRHTDWDFFDGYPPNLRMRKLTNGIWEVRQATEEEMQEFLASEAEFLSKLAVRPRGPLSPEDRFPDGAERDVSTSNDGNQTPKKKI